MTINRDSAVNQRICAKLVEREVICCVSSLVHHFASNEDALVGSDYSYDDVLDLCTNRTDHSERLEEIEQEVEDAEDSKSDLEEELFEAEAGVGNAYEIRQRLSETEALIAKLADERANLEAEQEEPNEVYEHWVVSEFLAGKLKEQGETVGELFNLTIWGRCTTGQSIAIDSVIVKIAEEMEILEGQKYSWAD